MRKFIVAGNWKMNKTLQEGIELARAVNEKVNGQRALVVLCTPFIHLSEVKKVITKSSLFLGAQNCSSKSAGAYTGETSASMIKSTGADYVIIGHSERRAYFKEADSTLNKKIRLSLENELIPIYCCGEVLPEREAGKHFEVVRAQINEGLFSLSTKEFIKVVIAYEPVWAIGTGVNATPEQAQEMHAFIRELISDKYGKDVAEKTTIQYGGSCKPSNAKEIFVMADVDGGLIGGASLNAEDFIAIVNSI
jgi:triosephosphate isomerase